MNFCHSLFQFQGVCSAASLAMLLALPVGASASTFADDFAGGLYPDYWTILQSTPGFYSVDASQGDVQLAKTTAHNPGGIQYVFVRLNLDRFGGPVTGDFAAQIDFTNAVVPGPGLDQVELHTYYEDGSIFYAVYDNSGGLNAHVWDGGAVRGTLATTQNSGTFRITRAGATVSGYFNDTPLYSLPRSSPLTAVDFVLQNNNSSDDAISVTFDRFSFTAATVRPPLYVSQIAAGQLQLSWSTNVAGCQLEQCSGLTAPSWTAVTNTTPTVSGSRFVQQVVVGEDQQFFRLYQP